MCVPNKFSLLLTASFSILISNAVAMDQNPFDDSAAGPGPSTVARVLDFPEVSDVSDSDGSTVGYNDANDGGVGSSGVFNPLHVNPEHIPTGFTVLNEYTTAPRSGFPTPEPGSRELLAQATGLMNGTYGDGDGDAVDSLKLHYGGKPVFSDLTEQKIDFVARSLVDMGISRDEIVASIQNSSIDEYAAIFGIDMTSFGQCAPQCSTANTFHAIEGAKNEDTIIDLITNLIADMAENTAFNVETLGYIYDGRGHAAFIEGAKKLSKDYGFKVDPRLS